MKTVLVTGANRGLGLGFVKHLLSLEYKVFATTRSPNQFPKENIQNPNLIIVPLDVTDDNSISNLYSTILSHTTSLDLLINNAGVSKDTVTNNRELVNNIESLDRETIIKVFNINSVSPLLIIKKLLPLLKVAENAFIINISSARASFKDEWDSLGYNSPNYGYRGSKAALSIMTHALTYELPHNIKTFSVDPGDVKTDMNREGEQEPVKTAEMIMEIVNKWVDKYNGEFLRYTGEPYPR